MFNAKWSIKAIFKEVKPCRIVILIFGQSAGTITHCELSIDHWSLRIELL